MNAICNDTACGHDGPHLHGIDVPRKVALDDAQDIDSARRLLMASFGHPMEPGEIPDMTLRQMAPPEGSRPIEIAQVTASFSNDTPVVRARFGAMLSSAIGLPGLKLAKDEAEGYRTWTIGVRSNLDFQAVITTWRTLTSFPGLEYLRFDGLAEMGLWIVDTNPEADDPRFTVAGP